MNESLALIAVLGVMSGAAIKTFEGYWNSPDGVKYSIKKLSGSLILAGIQAPLAIGVSTLFGSLDQSVGYVATFFMTMSEGYVVDSLHTATKN